MLEVVALRGQRLAPVERVGEAITTGWVTPASQSASSPAVMVRHGIALTTTTRFTGFDSDSAQP